MPAPQAWLSAARNRVCPSCAAPELLPGPRGGASQNFYCLRCRQGWNLHGVDYGVIDVEPIGLVSPELIELYLGFADGEELRRAVLKTYGWSDEQVEEVLRHARLRGPRPKAG